MKGTAKALLGLATGFALLLPLASAGPDGLQRVAISLGIKDTYRPWSGLFSGYSLALTGNPYLDELAAGLLGLVAVFAIAWFAGLLMARRSVRETAEVA